MSSTELSAADRAIVSATKPVLEEHGVAITSRMYERLFAQHPETEALFRGTEPGQAERLAEAVIAYASHIDDLTPIVPVVQAIAAKHIAAGVSAEHYPIVGEALLGAMVDVLGDLDASILDAWGAAYGFLANIFIGVETDLRNAA